MASAFLGQAGNAVNEKSVKLIKIKLLVGDIQI